ncbi:MAG: HAD hydrolase-like protein, partial [Actinomycetaceae bacterium]|nr:HAD hydrolase-like protein [Actinomycetaceae bacterium]
RGGRQFDRDDRGGRSFDRDKRADETSQPEEFAAYEQFDREFDEPTNTIDGLVIPEGLEATELDAEAYQALATLGEKNQEAVAKLLVMAGQLIDLDPELAYSYAQVAVKRAGRVDLVREAAALTAYATDRYAEALREVRAVRRMRDDFSLRAVEADCERGLGKPEKALEIVADTDMSTLDLDEQVELVLVSAGARADLKEHETALILLDDALTKMGDDADSQLVRRLMLAKADQLRALERSEEADQVEAMMPAAAEDNDILDIRMLAESDVTDRRSDLKGSVEALSARYDTLVLDLDGVCYMGKDPIDHAAPEVSTAVETGMKHVFVTNNSSRTPEAIAAQLTELGFPAEPNEIMTSGMDAMGLMQDELDEGAKVFVIGGDGLRKAVESAGFILVHSADDKPDAVVQGFDRSVDWEMLSEGALAINAGARFFATNLDASLPVERGFALGNGALVRAVRYATSKKPLAAGKPLPGIFQRGIQLVGGDRAVAIGDRLETDIAGALSASVPSMHVLTGVHDAKAVILSDRGLRPQFVHLDMRGLNEPHPRPQHHQDGTWTCGLSQVAKVENGLLTLDGVALEDDVTVTLDSYRALIAAAWDHATESPKVKCPTITVVDNDDPAGIVSAPDVPQSQDSEETSTPDDSSESDAEAQARADLAADAKESDISEADLADINVDEIPEFLPGEEELEALMEETAHMEDPEQREAETNEEEPATDDQPADDDDE